MQKLQVVFLFVFLMGCSPGQIIRPTEVPGIVQSLTPTQTAIPPTQTLTSTSTFTPSLTPTAMGGGTGKIAFVSDRDGIPEIYIMNSDGSEQIALTNDIIPKYGPSWSPDGTKIAFGTNDDDSASFYIMNADGSNPVKLIDTIDIDTYDQATPDWRFGGSPFWSPDGTKIAFKVTHYIGCCFTAGYVHVLNADGSYLTSVTINVWEDPVWSPDSQKIAFGSGCGGPWGICVVNADGTNPINIASSTGPDGWPSWSPDGKRVAFSSSRNGTSDIYVVNSDGANLANLTNSNNASDGGPDAGPIWSPDGEKIVFRSSRDDGSAIYVMNVDGTNLINLASNHPADGRHMVWSPDSTKIAFVSPVEGISEIYVIDADGGDPVKLTNNTANDYSPAGSPGSIKLTTSHKLYDVVSQMRSLRMVSTNWN